MSEKKRRRLPPDPDGLNDERAQWAGEAIDEYIRVVGDSGDTDAEILGYLLVDLHHWADRKGVNWRERVRAAGESYKDETTR